VSHASVIVVGGRDAELSSLRSLRVVLPSGEAYWTVVDDEYRVVVAADAFLRDLRFGADRTESTTKLYAGELALLLGWAAGSGRDLERAARELSRFVLLLGTTPITRQGRGYGRPRGAGRINHLLAVVREFIKHQVARGRLDARVLAALYEVGDDRFLPAELRAEDGGLRYRVRPRHRLRAERPAASGPPPSRSGRRCCRPPTPGATASCWCCCRSRGCGSARRSGCAAAICT
jgi:hypothetical protein